jgi:transposase
MAIDLVEEFALFGTPGRRAWHRGGQMPKKRRPECQLPVLQPHAAGVDIGAEEVFVAVPADCDAEPVRHFGTFTRDLYDLADWLGRCGIQTVAMESTSVYWIPLHQILEDRGFSVYLVNAHYVKNVPGRKSDVSDCQWIQYLHSVGLLRASFRPPAEICAIRSLWRHRESLVQMAAQHTLHMQKSLDQMNLHLHHVLSSITGVSGLAILDAILAGERDPVELAKLCHWRVKSSRDTVAKALEGDYRYEHLFTLKQSLAGYRYYQRLIVEVDQELEKQLQVLPAAANAEPKMPKRTKRQPYQKQRNEPEFDLRREVYRIVGVDLTDVPGISAVTAHTIVSEIGTDVSRFRNASAFTSWLGLCPEKSISGGKVLYTRTRKVKNRVSIALRAGAQCLYQAQNYLGEFFRRMKWKLGTPAAVTATAHKLARIIYHLLSTREPYNESLFLRFDEAAAQRAETRLRKQAAKLGFQIVPNPA